jgi:gamma-D-glutamyl-L-lysine dipeptidyl-peptidase
MDAIGYGVCRLSVVPVRKEPSDRSEQVTQLLFGDDYEVLEYTQDKRWLNIRITFDQYTGWIDANQHHSISSEFFDYISRAEFKITTDLTSSLLYNKSTVHILIGSVIPISTTELFKMEEQFAFNGNAKSLGQKREMEFLRSVAQKYINAPYLWGGKSPFGIDCSGLVQMVFKICGYRLQRDAWQQATNGKAVDSFAERAAGDIAFFADEKGKIVHTGILLQEDKILHASGRVRIDQITEQGIVNSETKALTHQFALLRRVLG